MHGLETPSLADFPVGGPTWLHQAAGDEAGGGGGLLWT